MDSKTYNITFEEMKQQFTNILLKYGFIEEKAVSCAQVFAQNSLDGVYTHGVNRFARFIEYVKAGHVQKDNEPTLVHSFGAIEQWNGNAGPGILNALFCTERAMHIATESGIGIVGLSNTNHWMRGGTYGWQAAKKGYALISWTNTIAVMPAWGAYEAKLGNNPMVIAVPYKDEAIVLDMAMSQFSYGKMEMHARRQQPLPVAGGLDEEGIPTTDAAKIIASKSPLPIGYWKGSGLALLLDILAAILSGGQATKDISNGSVETNVSQVFIAIDMKKLGNYTTIPSVLESIIADYTSVNTAENSSARYPGEGVLKTRQENLDKGIPVDAAIWQEILNL